MGDDLSIIIRSRTRYTFLSTSPVWGTTRKYEFYPMLKELFLSTSLVWGTTPAPCLPCILLRISIHVPRMGDDHSATASYHFANAFLSTSPVWGTTQIRFPAFNKREFLSTSPVWGTTARPQLVVCGVSYFYPRPPYGGRQQQDANSRKNL